MPENHLSSDHLNRNITRPNDNCNQLDAGAILSQLAFDQNDRSAAPDSALARYATVTGKGFVELPRGIAQSFVDDVTHPIETLKMVGTAAALGATLRLVLPEAGWVGKIAGVAMGGYFLARSADPIFHAYGKAGDAKTMGELNTAANDLGNAGGALVFNSALSTAGFRAGAGLSGRILGSKPLHAVAEFKATTWNGLNDKITACDPIAIGKDYGFAKENVRSQIAPTRGDLLGYVKNNHTHVPAWTLPVRGSLVSDASDHRRSLGAVILAWMRKKNAAPGQSAEKNDDQRPLDPPPELFYPSPIRD